MQQKQAEVRAIDVLRWLISNKELLPVFLSATGVTAQDLRDQAGNPVFLGSVLEFVMLDDAWVMACCDQLGWPYEALMQARQALPGGQDVNWT